MKILFVVPYTPSLIRIRSYSMIRALASRGHEITVATLWETAAEKAGLAEIGNWGVRVISQHQSRARSLANSARVLLTPNPLQAHYCWNPKLSAHCTRLDAQGAFDVVHVEHLRGARYGLAIRHAPSAICHTPVVWDSVDCISHLFEQAAEHPGGLFGRWMTRFEIGRTRRFEAWLQTQFDHVLVTSPVDRQQLLKLAASLRSSSPGPDACRKRTRMAVDDRTADIAVIPMGVDLDYFVPTREVRQPLTLVFSGKMSYHANVAAVLHLAREIMPLVWSGQPDTVLWIVGKDPPPEVRRLAGIRIKVTGTVPDMRPYLSRATASVAPTPYGAGIQIKVLEAMACGTPVIASSQACSALSAERGKEVLVADDPGSFAGQVLEVLGDPALRSEVGMAGRHYVEREHRWETIIAHLEAIYDEVTSA